MSQLITTLFGCLVFGLIASIWGYITFDTLNYKALVGTTIWVGGVLVLLLLCLAFIHYVEFGSPKEKINK